MRKILLLFLILISCAVARADNYSVLKPNQARNSHVMLNLFQHRINDGFCKRPCDPETSSGRRILIAARNDSYNVLKPNQAKSLQINGPDEKLLFILDYSASMTDKIGNERKIDLMIDTMKQILPKISRDTWVGLRVYGHRLSFTQYDSCHASSTLVPISPGSSFMIQQKLERATPRGMTPITYSLKKSLDSDFAGFGGKKHIILLTDGGENCDESPCVWAMELIKVRKDVKIDVIAFNVNDRDALDQLQCTALVTTGKFYSAKTAAELANSMRKSLGMKKEVDAVIIPNP